MTRITEKSDCALNSTVMPNLLFTDELPTEHSPTAARIAVGSENTPCPRFGETGRGSISIRHQPDLVMGSGWRFLPNFRSPRFDFGGIGPVFEPESNEGA